VQDPQEAKNLAGESPPPDSDPFSDTEFGKNLASLSSGFVAGPSCRLKLDKRSQLFIPTRNETLSVAAMCVSNPDRSPLRNQGLRRNPNSKRLCSDLSAIISQYFILRRA
jgi:hypothetical protein